MVLHLITFLTNYKPLNGTAVGKFIPGRNILPDSIIPENGAQLDVYNTTDQSASSDETSDFLILSWDKNDTSAKDYQQSYCPFRCHGRETIAMYNTGQVCLFFQCSGCFCDRPACEIYDLCCPNISEPYYPLVTGKYSGYEEEEIRNMIYIRSNDAVDSRSTCDMTYSDYSVLFIHACPTSYTERADTKEKCEITADIQTATFDTFQHVLDVDTGVLYWNKYCAHCNGAIKVIHLLLSLS